MTCTNSARSLTYSHGGGGYTSQQAFVRRLWHTEVVTRKRTTTKGRGERTRDVGDVSHR